MISDNPSQTLTHTVETLASASSLKGLFRQHRVNDPLPSSAVLEEIIMLSRSVLFPGYFGKSNISQSTIRYHIGVGMERLNQLLTQQIMAGLCFANTESSTSDNELQAQAARLALTLLNKYPEIRKTLATDVIAAYNGDPAAESPGEIISCYPIIKTLVNYRIAHELHLLKVPLIPRIITEMAHSETGIDIHPAAQIGHHFTIDHGTGTVIGATCIIGNNVKLYQGVTLGAKSFPLDQDGNPIKGIPRHPILQDNVIVYSNATILGRIVIGEGCVVGANLWITRDMPPHTKKYKQEKNDYIDLEFNHGTGI